MVLDRDYPVSRLQVVILVVGLLVMAGIGVALFGGYLPGIHPDYAQFNVVTIDGHSYHLTQSLLHTPLFSNHTAPWNVSFENVTFELWLTDWFSVTGGVVHGIGTEPNGTAYPFVLGILAANGTRQTLYLSPDAQFGVSWRGGFVVFPYVTLLVEF